MSKRPRHEETFDELDDLPENF
ncbi:hypothetical protein KIPB_006580, partial [Kipferlia bialata]|eukprot:g6580.t1